MANRNSGGRARPRKRRPAGRAASKAPRGSDAAVAPPGAPGDGRDSATDTRRNRTRAHAGAARDARRGGARPSGGRPGAGDRPEAPWHPLPLSELLILVGGIGVVVGLFLRKGEHGAPVLFAGLGAVMLGTFEVTLREHRSGFRSHTLLLAAIPTIAFHSVIILAVAALTHVPRGLNLGLLVPDAALFAVLFKLLRSRFEDARRERAFAGRR